MCCLIYHLFLTILPGIFSIVFSLLSIYSLLYSLHHIFLIHVPLSLVLFPFPFVYCPFWNPHLFLYILILSIFSSFYAPLYHIYLPIPYSFPLLIFPYLFSLLSPIRLVIHRKTFPFPFLWNLFPFSFSQFYPHS